MSRNTDSNQYTILFAIGMVVIVGSLLAFTASSLKPNIAENERMEKQQNILNVYGTKTVQSSTMTVEEPAFKFER